MSKPTLTGRIRSELQNFGRDEIDLHDLGDKLGVQTREDLKKVRYALKDLAKQGEVEKIGVNLYRAKPKAPGQPSKQEVMWRVLRARRSVTASDLQELADVDRSYAQEFLRSLLKRGVVRQAGANGDGKFVMDGKFVLVEDQVELPKNEAKADYLRQRRSAKKQALEALDAVFAAVAEARMAVAGLEE